MPQRPAFAMVAPKALASRSRHARWPPSDQLPGRQRAASDAGPDQPGDWAAAMRRAPRASHPAARPSFFRYRFAWVEVGDGKAFATGYYEPEIRGSREPASRAIDVPIYATPADLVRCTRADGTTGRGRIDRRAVRRSISPAPRSRMARLPPAARIAWAADPIDLFFLQIQGSGRLRAARRVGHADRLCRAERPRICRDRAHAARAQPASRRAARRCRDRRLDARPPDRGQGADARKSELHLLPRTDRAPDRSARWACRSRRAPRSPPTPNSCRSARRCCSTWTAHEANGLWVAQDTGGAIKGANRVDTFWGAGAAAESDRRRHVAQPGAAWS